MGKEFLINAGLSETRMAVLEEKKLVEIVIERLHASRRVGNIYRGKVENILPGMEAAFVNIGMEKNAFLYVDDLQVFKGQEEEINGLPPSINKLLRVGQEIIVQVVKEPIGSKGARVVTNLTIPGRYFVLMPSVNYVGVSRRIEDEDERERLRAAAQKLRPRGMGLIVRTAAEGVDEKELRADRDFLLNLWQKVRKKARKGPVPALLYHDHDLLYRMLRDLFTEDIERLIIDEQSAYRKALEFLNSLNPRLKDRVELYRGTRSLFDFYGIESQIEEALQSKVWLPSGAYLVFDQGEALTMIDVNTGKFTGSTNLEDTVLATNLEAAQEISRQIRLRNLGGIIIIDFIDMGSEKNRRQVLEVLSRELAKDKQKSNLLGFTALGLLEMTRKKIRPSLRGQLQQPCAFCNGTGYHFSLETQAAAAERRIIQLAAGSEKDQALLVGVNPAVAALLIGPGGSHLDALEKMTGKTVFIRGREEVAKEDVKMLAMGELAFVQKQALPVREGEILGVKVLEAHANNPVDGIARLEGYVIDIEDGGRCLGETVKVLIEKVYRTYARARLVDG